MTNIPPRDPTPPRGPSLAGAKADRRNYIAIAAIAVVLVVGAIVYFSSQGPIDSGTPPAATEPAPAGNAPADNNTGTTTP